MPCRHFNCSLIRDKPNNIVIIPSGIQTIGRYHGDHTGKYCVQSSSHADYKIPKRLKLHKYCVQFSTQTGRSKQNMWVIFYRQWWVVLEEKSLNTCSCVAIFKAKLCILIRMWKISMIWVSTTCCWTTFSRLYSNFSLNESHY